MAASIDPRSPCLIGVARRTWHPDEVGPEGAPEPLAMWEEVTRQAAADSGAPGVLDRLGRIDVVYSQAWQYDDPPGRLAERLGVSVAEQQYSGIGGSKPQTLMNEAAEAIVRGDLDCALIVGAEALATVRRLKKAGAKPEWSYKPAERRPFPFDIPFHPAEVSHSIFEAYLTFALFENARRAHRGWSPAEHRAALGRLMAPLTEVAAANKDAAWFPIARTPDEIAVPTPDNRMVAYPYTKLMTSIMDVDMAAAVLLASEATADELGVPRDQRVYLRGWAYAEDPYYVAERRELWRSPGMRAASQAALTAAGVGIDDVAHIDVYSCFASSVGFAIDALGLDQEASSAPSATRPVTVTGALPYHGGPGSNYMTHSVAAIAERLRAEPGSYGLVSGVGMHMTKHVYAVWSTEPGVVRPPDQAAVSAAVAADLEVAPIVDRHDGEATVATYSVLHGRDGGPEWGALVCDLDGGGRCYARLDDADALAAAEAEEFIGTTVHLTTDGEGVNRARV
jgi:acetyl-CoA C-acetyltransferase